jgi:hypothetical protein
MKTIALRFSDNFAPLEGTIFHHNSIINLYGFVWYGKLGVGLSSKAIEIVLNNEKPRILVINSGKFDRYWFYVVEITKTKPDQRYIPEYYRDNENFKTWFKVVKIEKAPKDILSKCNVYSSGAPLSIVSKTSMSPYFHIELNID